MKPVSALKYCAVVSILSAAALSARAADEQSASEVPVVNEPEIWKDPSKSPQERAADLVRRMTLEEKASQILANPPAIERLGIKAYSHRNECLHGVAGNNATVFPQAIGMAATWDTPLIHQEADVVSTEGRARHNDDKAKHGGNTSEHFGVNFYSPNINIFRDPRWGRGQETYGEDPFLTGQFAVAFITGLQGDDLAHPKAIACAKHYAVHSGPEKERHHMNMTPSERDLYDTYLPAFETSVVEAKVGSVMGAYSALNGKPCCADPFLLTQVLRERWGFNGVVFSDGGAIGDIWAEHKFVPGPIEAAAAAVKAGCDVSSGGMGKQPDLNAPPGHNNDGIEGGYGFVCLPQSVARGLITEAEVNQAVTRELEMRFRLGLFNPPDKDPYSSIGLDQKDTPQHRQLALKVAQESMTLLKNDGLLPLDKSKYKKIAVIGPNADAEGMQRGNYTGRPSQSVSILEGIKKLAGDGIEVAYSKGSPLAVKRDNSDPPKPELAQKALVAAKDADLIIFVSGIDASLEKEEGPARKDEWLGFSRGDRVRIDLPKVQQDLIRSLHELGKPMVLVNCSGSAMALPWENENIPAILQAWYPGEEGGTAVAQVLFGEVNPAGRTPVTFYASVDDLPKFEDYSMTNRTYRYFKGKPLYAFGHGLSYTRFDYADAKADADKVSADGTFRISFTVKNTGGKDGDEVAQIYYRPAKSSADLPKLALCGFKRVTTRSGESANVSIDIPAKRFRHWDSDQHKYVVDVGAYELLIGGASDQTPLKTTVTVQ